MGSRSTKQLEGCSPGSFFQQDLKTGTIFEKVLNLLKELHNMTAYVKQGMGKTLSFQEFSPTSA